MKTPGLYLSKAAGLILLTVMALTLNFGQSASLFSVPQAHAQTEIAKTPADPVKADNDNVPDVDWPREIKSSAGTILIYQPQLDELAGPNLKGRAAFSLKKNGSDKPVFGALWFEARVDTDTDERLAYIDNTQITQVRLPEASDEENASLAKAIESGASKGATTISLDRLAVALKEAETERKEAENLNTDAPNIIISNTPAVLLYIDGKPKLGAIEGTKLLAMENTPFPIVLDPTAKKFYLNGGTIWYESADIKGPWKFAEKVPAHISALIKLTDEQKKDLVKLTGTEEDKRVPEIIYADKPTELVVIDGKPSFTPVVGAELLYVENSETSIFLDPGPQKYYILLSGRWYENAKFEQEGWTYIHSDNLPETFAKIPEDSDRGSVLSQIAGTEQAEEAIAEASIPQVTAISRKTAKTSVTYEGEPKFEPITGTKMFYAVNTSSTVLQINNRFYVVDQGVWFVSDSPTGPWVLAEEVPEEVEDIPPSNPTYNVKYVKVYETTPEYVYVGYTPGYLGSYIYAGTLVYGTGYIYRSWWGPYYYPRPLTWGLGAYFRPWWGWGYSVGWGRFHFHAGFGPGYGWHRYHRRGWYGPGGYHSNRYNRYRARHHRAAHYRNRNNIYNRGVNRNRNQFNRARPNRDRLRRDFAGKGNRANNVFTDRKGNVYRRNKNGWQKRDGKQWKQTKLDRSARPGAGNKRPGAKDKAQRPKQRPANKAQKPKQRPANKAQKPKKRQATKKQTRKPQATKKQTRKRTQQARKPQQRRTTSNQRTRNSHNMQRQYRSRNRGSQRSRSYSGRSRSYSGGRSRGGGGRGRGGGGGRRR